MIAGKLRALRDCEVLRASAEESTLVRMFEDGLTDYRRVDLEQSDWFLTPKGKRVADYHFERGEL